jgi:serine O-acetyltransferase
MELLEKQLNSFFIDVDMVKIGGGIEEAYRRCMVAISSTNDKYLKLDGAAEFKSEHSGCWSIFLYYLSNSLTNFAKKEAEQIYYLNKILHSVDWYCEIELPDHFMVEHPLGSILGRAHYGDYLFIFQGVTIGGNNQAYPTIGTKVCFYSDAKVVGNSHIGDNVVFGANTYVKDEDIPSNSIVFGSSPNLIIKQDTEKIEKVMKSLWKD